MRYAIIKMIDTDRGGITSENHFKKDGLMVVNEKELAHSDMDMSKVVFYTNKEIKIKIKKDGFKL